VNLDLTRLGAKLQDAGEYGMGVYQSGKPFQASRNEAFAKTTGAITIDKAFKYMLEKEASVQKRNDGTFCGDLKSKQKLLTNAYKEYLRKYQGDEAKKTPGYVQQLLGRQGCASCNAQKREEEQVQASGRNAVASDPRLKQETCKFCQYVEEVKSTCQKLHENKFKTIKKELPDLMAKMFAVWTVLLSVEGAVKLTQLTRPHTVQVLTIMRLLGLDTDKTQDKQREGLPLLQETNMQNHLAEVITGGGKSVILGGLSTLLALLGVRVNCVCYSAYLSQRDERFFAPLWELFGVKHLISYSTLGALVDAMMNEEVDIRQATESFLLGKEVSGTNPATVPNPESKTAAIDKARTPRVLLIDEVDVFFGTDFYGNAYNTGCTLKDSDVQSLMRHIWEKRDQEQKPTLAQLQTEREYSSFVQKYPRCQRFLDLGLQQMLADVNEFAQPAYEVQHGKLGYKEGDGLNFRRMYGYRTMFAYLNEEEQGSIDAADTNQVLGLSISCGAFSYAKIPERFDCILGVTGTLDCMSEYEKTIIKHYGILKRTYTPSIYTESTVSPDGLYQNKNLKTESLQVLQDGDGLNQAIANHINGSLFATGEKKRPCVVFFDSESRLQSFQKVWPSAQVVNIGDDTKIAPKIGQAGTANMVTLLPAVFGRGTDFKVNDVELNPSGGMHVIQTFFAASMSEEAQIKGRTARQMAKGTYQILVIADDVKKKFGLSQAESDALLTEQHVYTKLCEYRKRAQARLNKSRDENLAEVTKFHDTSSIFLEELRKYITQQRAPSAVSVLNRCLWAGQLLRQPECNRSFVLDRSGSMMGDDTFPVTIGTPPKGFSPNRMGAVHEAVSQFFRTRSHHPDDRFSVFVFDHEVKSVFERRAPPSDTQTCDAFVKEICALMPQRGRTNYDDCWQNGVLRMLTAGQEMKLNVQGAKVLFLTDGAPNPQIKNVDQWLSKSISAPIHQYKRTTYTDAAGRQFDKSISIWCVKFGNDKGDFSALNALAAIPGAEGRKVDASDASKLASIFSNFSTQPVNMG
jgi:hypothetical protein